MKDVKYLAMGIVMFMLSAGAFGDFYGLVYIYNLNTSIVTKVVIMTLLFVGFVLNLGNAVLMAMKGEEIYDMVFKD